MSISEIKPGEQVKDVHFTEDTLSVDLLDGRTITVPLVWFPRLLKATLKQRKNWKICGGMAFTGRTLMKTSALRACFGAHRRRVKTCRT